MQEISREASEAQNYLAVRKQQVTAANAVLLHEFYFRNLGAGKAEPSHYVRGNMSEHMGTLEVLARRFRRMRPRRRGLGGSGLRSL